MTPGSPNVSSVSHEPARNRRRLVAQDVRRRPAGGATSSPRAAPTKYRWVWSMWFRASGRPTRRRSSGRPAARPPPPPWSRSSRWPARKVKQVEIHDPLLSFTLHTRSWTFMPPAPPHNGPDLRGACGDTSGDVRLRRCGLDQPVRGVRPPGGRARPAYRVHPHRQCHQSRRQRLGPLGAERDRASTPSRRRGRPRPRALGHELDGRLVLERLSGDIRPQMVAAIDACRKSYKTACLTNNFASSERVVSEEVAEVYALFDAVLESRVLGVRKPDPRFYELACATLGVEPEESVFLDDLGVNLKPARAARHAHHQGDRSRRGAGGAGGSARAPRRRRLSESCTERDTAARQADGGAAAALSPAKRPNSVLSPMESPLA